MVEVPKRDKMSNEFVSRTMIGKNELMKEVQEIRRKRIQEKNKKKEKLRKRMTKTKETNLMVCCVMFFLGGRMSFTIIIFQMKYGSTAAIPLLLILSKEKLTETTS